jgi:Mg/Co/Ni transporter MgtE
MSRILVGSPAIGGFEPPGVCLLCLLQGLSRKSTLAVLTHCGYRGMASNLEKEEILEAAIASVPRVAQVIEALSAEDQVRALDAAKQSYLQTAQDLGYAERPAQEWVTEVMFRLRLKMERERWAKRMRLKILHSELIRARSGAVENDSMG